MEEIEYNHRVKAIIEKLLPKGRAEKNEIDELFFLYNLKMKPTETGKSCAGCRQRVYKRMQEYYHTIKNA